MMESVVLMEGIGVHGQWWLRIVLDLAAGVGRQVAGHILRVNGSFLGGLVCKVICH